MNQKQDMTIEEAVSYYHSLLRFGMKPGLARIDELCTMLGAPQEKPSYIHIAGTNGKGSVAVMLSEIFRAGGYRVGLYTSPYITKFSERIQIDGQPVEDDLLCRATLRVKAAVERLAQSGETVTEFEAVTAAAFLCFAESGCELVILETGLGGRFDATNIIRNPLVSVITSISLDHTAVLGDTVQQIAFEKSGIIKPGCPTVCPDSLPEEALAVLETVCRVKESALTIVNTTDITVKNPTLTGFDETFGGLSFHVPLAGTVQSENAALAVTAARLTAAFPVTDAQIIQGIAHTVHPARCELLCKNPAVLLDGCHNDASTMALSDLLSRQLRGRKILAVMGMMADKDIDRALAHLLPHFAAVITTTPSNPRAIAAEDLANKIRERGVNAESCAAPQAAILLACKRLAEYDALVVCGSLYLAGDVRNILRKTVDELFEK